MGAHLPTLDPGVTYLEGDAPAALYRLVGHHLTETDGTARWLDARNAAVPRAIREHALGRTADRLRVARAFTGYQHYELARELPRRVSSRTALIVAPNVAALYAAEELSDREGETMLAATLEILSELADTLDLPVVVTADAECERVRVAADRTLDAMETQAGLRIDGPTFGTDVYWRPWGYQTTISYWVDLLGTREDAPDVPTVGDPEPVGV